MYAAYALNPIPPIPEQKIFMDEKLYALRAHFTMPAEHTGIPYERVTYSHSFPL